VTGANLAAAKRAAERKPQGAPARATASSVASAVTTPTSEIIATADASAAPSPVASGRRPGRPVPPTREARTVTEVPTVPHTKSDLIRPY
jgi:hypothetical protein